MDPPLRPSSLRRTTSTQNVKSFPPNDLARDSSPTPLALKSQKILQGEGRTQYIAPSQISALGWEGDDGMVSRSTTRLQVELAECVETKTVTTTTTTKRTYPPLLVQPPRSLHALDAKEYPLALKPTPYELTNFSYEVDGKIVHFCEDNPVSSLEAVCPSQSCLIIYGNCPLY
jgi:F-box and WD-40 domain protein CDC4